MNSMCKGTEVSDGCYAGDNEKRTGRGDRAVVQCLTNKFEFCLIGIRGYFK